MVEFFEIPKGVDVASINSIYGYAYRKHGGLSPLELGGITSDGSIVGLTGSRIFLVKTINNMEFILDIWSPVAGFLHGKEESNFIQAIASDEKYFTQEEVTTFARKVKLKHKAEEFL
jgi:hypothetical protein